MIEISITSLLYIFVLVQLAVLVSILIDTSKSDRKINSKKFPFVSVLIAARNESANVNDCIKALSELDYPKEKIEILFGDDNSTDDTFEKIRNLISDKSEFKLFRITDKIGVAKAKANVLAQLMKEAKGEIIFTTDADITVNPNWIRSLIKEFDNPELGIVSGISVVEGKSLFAKLQGLEWLYYSGIMQALTNLGLKITAVGNNMAFRTEAYLQTGGYENIEFSVTEDLQLYKAIRAKGWQSSNLLSALCMNKSKAQPDFTNLLHQRKRWMMGAINLPVTVWLILLLYALFLPLLLTLFFLNSYTAITIYIVKFILQSLTIIAIKKSLKVKKEFVLLPLYEVYVNFMSMAMCVFYILPIPMKWKERNF